MHKKDSIILDIKNLGVHSADSLLVHSSMKAIGDAAPLADLTCMLLEKYPLLFADDQPVPEEDYI